MNFFDINNSEIKNRLIYENELIFAFPSNIPIVPGHTLICPKRIVSNINELTQKELLAIFDLQKQIKEAMFKIFNADGFNYEPREFLYRPTNNRPISPEQELIEIAELIKKNLS